MIIVSGASGQIGSALSRKLNSLGHKDLILIDSLKDGKKILNLRGVDFIDFIDYREFRINFMKNKKPIPGVSAFFHLGACSSTSEWDGEYLMDNNFAYSKEVLHWCNQENIQFIYASSASVYGNKAKSFCEIDGSEDPINAYAFSKYAFDCYVRANFIHFDTQIVGLRYFNVYGSSEFHKNDMASPVYQFYKQLKDTGRIKLFGDYGDIRSEDISRDFIHADDCADVNIWFYKNKDKYGIFNVGTGIDTSFHEIAKRIIEVHGSGKIDILDFPEKFKGSYQFFTRADLSELRKAGCDHSFTPLSEGIEKSLLFYEENI